MIKNIVFDMGNVLVDFCWEEDFHNKGLFGETFERVADATTRNEDWDEFDLANLTHEEIIEKFIENDPEMAEEIRLATSTIKGMIRKRDYAEDIIIRAKKAGYKVLLLSNFSPQALNEAASELTYIPLADGYIFSCDYHVVKPSKEIYNLLLEKYDIKAEETVFLDDSEKNIKGAIACGINGIVFKNLNDAMKQLKDLGVEF